MNAQGQVILDCLQAVAQERAARAAEPRLAAAVTDVKAYQHARFETTYADLLDSTRYRRAARFFLEDLYGPGDFTRRDTEFARIVPGLVRIFPSELVATVASVGELHSLSEALDSAMARALLDVAVDRGTGHGAPPTHDEYATCWRRVGRAPDRLRQIALMLTVGKALDRYTRMPLLRQSLRLMSGPARAAGLSTLHEFLVAGFETFREMRGADEFLATIELRETALAERLFAGGCVA